MNYNQGDEQGQVLLVVIMLIATVLTVVLSASYQVITETKITKMEEDSQKALAAAEAGIEYSLKSNTPINIGEISNNFSNFTGQTTIENTTGKEFSTPLINKDSQYTFYLADYEKTSGFSNYYTGDLTVYWQNSASSCGSSRTAVALELTLVYNNNQLKKWVYDPCSDAPKLEGALIPSVGTYNIDGVNYQLQSETIAVGDYSDAQLLIVHPLYNGTKIGFQGSDNLRIQGNYVNSTASTPDNTTKTIRVFHSQPQIPADFFVTQF